MILPEIKIVNLRQSLIKRPTMRIDRQTFLGNPFVIGKDGNRQEVIERYQLYFDEMMLHDEEFKQSFYELAETYSRYPIIQLACWCAPEPCHGLIIKQALEEIYREKP